jgi:polyphosphate kinase
VAVEGTDGRGEHEAAPAGAVRYLNRELSWLDFNGRVLALAEDPSVPLLERSKFLAIFSQNLDEFFQVRVAGLKEQVTAGIGVTAPDGRTPSQQLAAIRERVSELTTRQACAFLDDVAPALAAQGVRFSTWDELDDDDEKFLVETFEQRIFPVLTPLAVDPGHPFPYISNLSLNLAVALRDPVTGESRFARVKVPDLLPRFVVMPDGERFVPLEQVIAAHLDQLFPGMEVSSHDTFRVTRNADLTLEEEEADDLLEAVEVELRRRQFGRAVRLEISGGITDEVKGLLQRELGVAEQDTYRLPGPLDLGGLWAVHALDRPDLKDSVFQRVSQARLEKVDDERPDTFAVLRDGDVLVHHPYDSFRTSVEEFIRQAAADPQVLAIKMTLYRTSGESPIVRSLIRAAERGKQVAVLVELKARFDESTNIEWAKALEQAGVHVVYGLVGLKVHAKTALVVRDEPDGIRRYCHIGTGNYNSRTARVYEDVGLLTCAPDIGADLTQLFNYLTGYGRDVRYRCLVVAPHSLRAGLLALIDGEVEAVRNGRPAAITAKMNSLSDVPVIEALYAASQAGVEVDLIVRGLCCLVPGVPGQSERIRVRSIVGRYLEHSRIYRFANGSGAGVARYLIGSADLMPRNLDHRVEALVPVEEPSLQRRLEEILEVNLADDTLAWTLGADGTWSRVEGGGTVETHERLQAVAVTRGRQPG